MKHYPVMLGEVIGALSPQDGETYLDGTFGNGGYSGAILESTNCNLNLRPGFGLLKHRFP